MCLFNLLNQSTTHPPLADWMGPPTSTLQICQHNFTVLARQVLVQKSSSSRSRSKRVMIQTKFDVPDPLVVHVLLLTHEFHGR